MIFYHSIDPTFPGWPQNMARLHKACFDVPWSEKSFQDLLGLSSVRAIGAFLDAFIPQKCVAFILCQQAAEVCDILTLCVQPLYRRRGVASTLIEKMVASLSPPVERYILEVAQSNHTAILLYERGGFTKQGVRPQYYRTASGLEAAYMMVRQQTDSQSQRG